MQPTGGSSMIWPTTTPSTSATHTSISGYRLLGHPRGDLGFAVGFGHFGHRERLRPDVDPCATGGVGDHCWPDRRLPGLNGPQHPSRPGSAMAMACAHGNQRTSGLSPCGRRGIDRRRGEVVADVEMGVPARAGMHVDVQQREPVRRPVHRQPGLLRRFPQRRIPRRLTAVDVAAGLQPQRQPLVEMQHHPGITGDDGRGGDCVDDACSSNGSSSASNAARNERSSRARERRPDDASATASTERCASAVCCVLHRARRSTNLGRSSNLSKSPLQLGRRLPITPV